MKLSFLKEELLILCHIYYITAMHKTTEGSAVTKRAEDLWMLLQKPVNEKKSQSSRAGFHLYIFCLNAQTLAAAANISTDMKGETSSNYTCGVN